MENAMPDQSDLLLIWLKRIRENQHAHYRAEVLYDKLHFLIGIPAAALATIVGTSVFATLNSAVGIEFKILTGCVSLAAAVLSGIQTFLRFSDRAERHRRSGKQYASIRRQIEHCLCAGNSIGAEEVKAIRARYDAVAAQAPYIPNQVWRQVEALGNDYFLSGHPTATSTISLPEAAPSA
jgi:hypothetical protein